MVCKMQCKIGKPELLLNSTLTSQDWPTEKFTSIKFEKTVGLYFKKITIERKYLFGNLKNAKVPASMDEFQQNGLE